MSAPAWARAMAHAAPIPVGDAASVTVIGRLDAPLVAPVMRTFWPLREKRSRDAMVLCVWTSGKSPVLSCGATVRASDRLAVQRPDWDGVRDLR